MTSVTVAQILFSPIALAILGYCVLMVALLYAMQPLRLRMVDIAEEMLREERWNKDQRHEINLLLDVSMSFRVGLVLWLAVVSLIVDIALNRVRAMSPNWQELSRDKRFQTLLKDSMISVAASNPLAAIVTALLMVVVVIVAVAADRIHGARGMTEMLEEPMLRALDSVGSGVKVAA